MGKRSTFLLANKERSVQREIFLLDLQQICHRDLKLENTLLDGSPAPCLKICDFGYSKVLSNLQTTAFSSSLIFFF